MSNGDVNLPPAVSPPRKAPRYHAWFRIGAIVAVVLLAAWVASGGYDRLTAPNPRWKLPNGDTIEVLTFQNSYNLSYSLTGARIEGAHYLWLQFRSSLKQPERHKSDVLAAARVLCPSADSNGVRRVKIEPTRTSFFGFVKYSRTYWFRVNPAGDCDEVSGQG
jgi:hypothetical protein